jgi:hypothetical protein
LLSVERSFSMPDKDQFHIFGGQDCPDARSG